MDKIRTVWDLPEKPERESGPEYEAFTRKMVVFVFWVDGILPAAAGTDDFGLTIRAYHLAVDKIEFKDGKMRQAVTVPTEAFAYLMYENCREKWEATLTYRDGNKKKTVPKYNKEDESTHVYHIGKWSDSKSGQVKGGGWHPDAFTAFNEYCDKVKKFRQQDKKDGWELYKLMKDVIRDKHDITGEQHSKKRKRKKSADPEEAALKYVDLQQWNSDMEDDDGSVDSQATTLD